TAIDPARGHPEWFASGRHARLRSPAVGETARSAARRLRRGEPETHAAVQTGPETTGPEPGPKLYSGGVRRAGPSGAVRLDVPVRNGGLQGRAEKPQTARVL